MELLWKSKFLECTQLTVIQRRITAWKWCGGREQMTTARNHQGLLRVTLIPLIGKWLIMFTRFIDGIAVKCLKYYYAVYATVSENVIE